MWVVCSGAGGAGSCGVDATAGVVEAPDDVVGACPRTPWCREPAMRRTCSLETAIASSQAATAASRSTPERVVRSDSLASATESKKPARSSDVRIPSCTSRSWTAEGASHQSRGSVETAETDGNLDRTETLASELPKPGPGSPRREATLGSDQLDSTGGSQLLPYPVCSRDPPDDLPEGSQLLPRPDKPSRRPPSNSCSITRRCFTGGGRMALGAN